MFFYKFFPDKKTAAAHGINRLCRCRFFCIRRSLAWASGLVLPQTQPWSVFAGTLLLSGRVLLAQPKALLVVALPPLPRKGAALDPPGNQSPGPRARIRSLIMRCAMLFFFFIFFTCSQARDRISPVFRCPRGQALPSAAPKAAPSRASDSAPSNALRFHSA